MQRHLKHKALQARFAGSAADRQEVRRPFLSYVDDLKKTILEGVRQGAQADLAADRWLSQSRRKLAPNSPSKTGDNKFRN
jgi:hypothetical protein